MKYLTVPAIGTGTDADPIRPDLPAGVSFVGHHDARTGTYLVAVPDGTTIPVKAGRRSLSTRKQQTDAMAARSLAGPARIGGVDVQAADWDDMMTPPPSNVEYLAPAALGTASFVVGILVEAPLAHALVISASLVAGMGAGTVVRLLYARRLRPPRTDG